MAIEEVKSVPYAPVSHPFIERLIGTIRREYLDHVFFWNAIDLVREVGQRSQIITTRSRVHRALCRLHASATRRSARLRSRCH